MTAQNIRRKPGTPRRSAAPTSGATVAAAPAVRDGFGVAAAVQHMERLREEGLRFATTRFEENRSTLHELLETPNLPDRVAIWSRHVERTMKQYSDGYGTFAGICREQARETVQESADAAQAVAAAIARITPSPMVEAVPPLPAAGPGAAPEAAPETAADPATASGAAPETAAHSEAVPADARRH